MIVIKEPVMAFPDASFTVDIGSTERTTGSVTTMDGASAEFEQEVSANTENKAAEIDITFLKLIAPHSLNRSTRQLTRMANCAN
jgi:hypothetical protein